MVYIVGIVLSVGDIVWFRCLCIKDTCREKRRLLGAEWFKDVDYELV